MRLHGALAPTARARASALCVGAAPLRTLLEAQLLLHVGRRERRDVADAKLVKARQRDAAVVVHLAGGHKHVTNGSALGHGERAARGCYGLWGRHAEPPHTVLCAACSHAAAIPLAHLGLEAAGRAGADDQVRVRPHLAAGARVMPRSTDDGGASLVAARQRAHASPKALIAPPRRQHPVPHSHA